MGRNARGRYAIITVSKGTNVPGGAVIFFGREMRKTEEKQRKKRDRYFYLNASADVLSKEVRRLTKETCADRENPPDLKCLKELTGVLKEAVSVCLSLEKSDTAAAPIVRVVFDEEIEEYSR